MRPIEFQQQNVVFAKDQPEYVPLPAYRSPDGEVTSCWGMSWRERLRVLMTGRVYFTLLTFGAALLQRLVIQWRHNAQGCGPRDQHAAGTWRACARELDAAIAAVMRQDGAGEWVTARVCGITPGMNRIELQLLDMAPDWADLHAMVVITAAPPAGGEGT